MRRSKLAISLDESILNRLDKLVRKQIFPNRSQAIQEAIEEMSHLGRTVKHLGRAGMALAIALAFVVGIVAFAHGSEDNVIHAC